MSPIALSREHSDELSGNSDISIVCLDVLRVEDFDDPGRSDPTEFVAGLIRISPLQYRSLDSVTDSSLYLFPLHRKDDVKSWFISSRASGIGRLPRRRTSRTSIPTDLWSLQHKSRVIAASWNHATASYSNKLLVSITHDMLAHIWRIGPSPSSYSMLVQVDIGERSFGPGIRCCWIGMDISVYGTVFTDKEYIIFHELSDDMQYTSVTGGDKPVPCSFEGSDSPCSAHRQHFKIFAIHGINSVSGKVDACCMLSHQDMFLPIYISDLKSADICGHTMRSGVVTLYAADSLRPNKVVPRCSFQMSRWITMTSRSITPPITDDFHDDVLGSQVALGLHKFVPPCTIDVVSELGLSVQLILTPCDLFLKDCNLSSGDNVVGLVGRYLCHAYSPQFIRSSIPGFKSLRSSDEVVLERFRSSKSLSIVEHIYNNEWFLAFLLYKTGRLELYRAICYNHAICQRTAVSLPDVCEVLGLKVLKRADSILLAAFVHDKDGSTQFAIYNWTVNSITLESSWPFTLHGHQIIQEFLQWYPGGPFYLISSCIMDGCNAIQGKLHVYLVMDSRMAHFLSIDNGDLYDAFLGETLSIQACVGADRYSLVNDRLESFMGDRVVSVSISDGSDSMADPLPIYHPRYFKVFTELGMRRFVDELVHSLVCLYRDFLRLLQDTSSCSVSAGSLYACDCVIAKVRHLDLFREFDRQHTLRFLYTFSTLIQCDPSHLIGEVYTAPPMDFQDTVPLNELLLYLQHLRMPGLAWDEQIELMRVIEGLRPKDFSDYFGAAKRVPETVGSGADTLSNFLRMTEPMPSVDTTVDLGIDFRISLDPEVTEDTGHVSSVNIACPLVRKAQHLVKSGEDERTVTMWRQNDKLVGLVLPPRITSDCLCLSRCVDYIKYGHADENHLVWAVLYRDDHNLFSIMTQMMDTGDDLALCRNMLSIMKHVGLGYWLSTASSLDTFCGILERGFRKLIAVTDSGCGVEVFDEFGLWSIVRGKTMVYACVLKAKGFQKLGEFLCNDFSEDRWSNAAVKNSYALIAQKRYLLAIGFLVLAGRMTDAVDVCFQYLYDAQLACLLCRIRGFSLEYALGQMQPSRVRDVLEYKLSSKRGTPIDVETVEHLVYYLYMSIRFGQDDCDRMVTTVRQCASQYRVSGMPAVAWALDSLFLVDKATSWRPFVCRATLRYLLREPSFSALQDCLSVLHELCGEKIHHVGSNVSNYGSDRCDRGLSDIRVTISDLDVEFPEEVLIFPESNGSPMGIGDLHGFQLHLITLVTALRSRYSLDGATYCSLGKTWLSHEVFNRIWSMPNYFSYLGTVCIGFFEGNTTIDGSSLLCLILRALSDDHDDFSSCIILSLASLLAIACFDRGDMDQIYDACVGQLVVLNSFVNNQGSVAQFCACLLRTIEPLCFGARPRVLEPQCINVLSHIDNSPKHTFFGICVGTAILETLLGICRSWIYKGAEHADSVAQTWIDHILYSASRYLHKVVKPEIIEDALGAAGIAYSMLSLRLGIDTPVEFQVDDKELRVYDSFLDRYVASVYGPEFEKLWRFLQCGLRTASVFSRHVRLGPSVSNAVTEDHYKSMSVEFQGNVDVGIKPSPLLIPLSSMFTTPQMWNQEFVSAQARIHGKQSPRSDANCDIAVLDALRALLFKALHNFKGKLVSTLYSMLSTTLYEDLKGLTCSTMIGPVLNDFYMLAMLNIPVSSKLSSLSEELSSTVETVLYSAINGTRAVGPSYALYVKLVRIMYVYCKNHLESVYSMKRVSRLSVFAGKVYNYFHHCNDKDHYVSGSAGGICGHPRLPLYAVVYGENQGGQMPAYNVSIQHPISVMSGYRDAVGEGTQEHCCEDILYDRVTGKRLNVGQGSVFGELSSLAWSGDWLSVLDRNGWLLIYNTRNMVHMNGEDADIAIPSIFFRPHMSATGLSWLSESYIATVGCGISQDAMTANVIVIDTRQGDISPAVSTSFGKEHSSASMELLDNSSSVRNETDHITRAVTEHRHPCVCIWDLVDVHRNNCPKLKVILANSSNIPHSIFNKKKHSVAFVRFTCVLSIPSVHMENHSTDSLDHDLVIFDSGGNMLFYSSAAHKVTVTCSAHSSAVAKCFYVNDHIVAVSQEGAIVMYRYNGIFSEPTRVFEGVPEPKAAPVESGSNGSLVASLGEYLGIRFSDSSSRDHGNASLGPREVVDAQIVHGRFLVLTTADGNASVTELPC
ncbi:RAVE protein 1 C terminal family protein [Babesia bovis T2Bo]|uniref:RAVE complex protein Rav1 C-terminal domain-containing protein n=1 Tax=Babesia bovis TaxID=5865 RepID=A7AVG5_BABBO|nr:RAVE protein 1 C terminal family protein [Babesia bovis T2Bo]EDO05791.1 RAVE protein 1 C terminal family protein [Babesia bovis T2Bo]|eukprot:XP_001609359.1 hypothetical protein [Babesia bovis T2Bo]